MVKSFATERLNTRTDGEQHPKEDESAAAISTLPKSLPCAEEPDITTDEVDIHDLRQASIPDFKTVDLPPTNDFSCAPNARKDPLLPYNYCVNQLDFGYLIDSAFKPLASASNSIHYKGTVVRVLSVLLEI